MYVDTKIVLNRHLKYCPGFKCLQNNDTAKNIQS